MMLTFSFTFFVIATFINESVIECRVPASTVPKTVTIALETKSGFFITGRAFDFVYAEKLLITEIVPIKGSLEGGYPFEILGTFDVVV